MEHLSQALKLMGTGIAAVFALMIGISVAIWLTGRAFVYFERRIDDRRFPFGIIGSRLRDAHQGSHR